MKRGTPRHPKVFALCELLNIGRAEAVGFLELLWHFTAEFAPDGCIGKFPVQRIEAACDWEGRKGRLVWALWKTGWLDLLEAKEKQLFADVKLPWNSQHAQVVVSNSSLVVHDWLSHCEASVHKRLYRQSLKSTGYPESDRLMSALKVKSGSLPSPLPSPLPLNPPTPLHSGVGTSTLLTPPTPPPSGGNGSVPAARKPTRQELRDHKAREMIEFFRRPKR